MKEKVQKILEEHFPNAHIQLSGDDYHVVLDIKDVAFNGLSRVKQHQLVYKTLGNMVGNELHALSLRTGGINE